VFTFAKHATAEQIMEYYRIGAENGTGSGAARR
jgi:hypothetical protein